MLRGPSECQALCSSMLHMASGWLTACMMRSPQALGAVWPCHKHLVSQRQAQHAICTNGDSCLLCR